MNPALDVKGHSASQPGLRAHSIGEVYPWRVVGYGDGSWAVEDCRGETFRRYWPRPGEDEESDRACKDAHEAARIAKVLHPTGRIDPSFEGPANISGALNEIPWRLAGHTLVVQYPGGAFDRFRVSHWQDDVTEPGHLITVTNRATGQRQRLSVTWLAHNPFIDVWLELR